MGSDRALQRPSASGHPRRNGTGERQMFNSSGVDGGAGHVVVWLGTGFFVIEVGRPSIWSVCPRLAHTARPSILTGGGKEECRQLTH